MATLEFRKLTKRYKNQAVLDDVSLRIEDGERLVLFGPSGAGKTVLLRLACGVIEPESGAILIDGDDVAMVDAEDRGIGMAFQNFALFPHMTAFDNIAAPLVARKHDAQEQRAQVHAIAKLLKIDHVLTHPPKALSNGQKQRTALARALVGSPPLLLLDDPLRNVDAKLRFEMRLELPRLLADQNATVIYVTQDYKEAMALGDRIAVMDAGRIQQLGPPEAIYSSPANIGIARLFGDPAINLIEFDPIIGDAGTYAEISSVQICVSDTTLHHACTLGVRPEAIRFVEPGTDGAIPVKVEAETPLNEKIVTLAVTKGGREILISRPAGTAGPAQGQASIAIDTKAASIFERSTGLNIAASGSPGLQAGDAA